MSTEERGGELADIRGVVQQVVFQGYLHEICSFPGPDIIIMYVSAAVTRDTLARQPRILVPVLVLSNPT